MPLTFTTEKTRSLKKRLPEYTVLKNAFGKSVPLLDAYRLTLENAEANGEENVIIPISTGAGPQAVRRRGGELQAGGDNVGDMYVRSRGAGIGFA